MLIYFCTLGVYCRVNPTTDGCFDQKCSRSHCRSSRKKVAVKAPDLTAKHRLPTTVAPVAYRISIEPNLSDFTYTGAVEIDIDVRKPTNQVVLNAVGLEIFDASLNGTQPRHRSMHRVSGLMLSPKSRCLKGRPRLPHPHPVRLHHSSWNFGVRSETSDNRFALHANWLLQ